MKINTLEEFDKILLTEADYVEWFIGDLKCVIRRHERNKHLCGYVGVKPKSKLYGHQYYCYTESEKGLSEIEKALNAIIVHGGLSFSGNIKGGCLHEHESYNNDKYWFFGFDCVHAGDISRWEMEWNIKNGFRQREVGEEYRDMEYVTNEVNKLAEQIKNIDWFFNTSLFNKIKIKLWILLSKLGLVKHND